jgi:5'-methylthioadenosine phosphorylase
MVKTLPAARSCKCGSALKHAILTDLKAVSQETKDRLGLLLGKYTG